MTPKKARNNRDKDMSKADAVIKKLWDTDMSLTSIAKQADCSVWYVSKWLNAQGLRKRRAIHQFESWDAVGPDEKMRKCLVCGHEFRSTHSLNRICSSCRDAQRNSRDDMLEISLYF
jgi:hypothetical protein